MNEEMIKEVLEDVLQELKDGNRLLTECRGVVAACDERVSGFEQKLKEQQVIVEPVDLTPALEVMRTEAAAMFKRESSVADLARGLLLVEQKTLREHTAKCIKDLSDVVEAAVKRIDAAATEQQKPIVRQYRYVLFEKESNYKLFMNWVFGTIVVVVVVGAFFLLEKQYIAKMEPVKVEQDQDWVGYAGRPAAAANDKASTPHRAGAGSSRKRLKEMNDKKRLDSIDNAIMKYLADSIQDTSH